jgi:hypothetical protein
MNNDGEVTSALMMKASSPTMTVKGKAILVTGHESP